MDDERSIRALARRIAAYLSKHPDAADSAEGISRWWLSQMRIDANGGSVQHALDLLVEQGAIARRVLPDRSCVYGRAVHNLPSQRGARDDVAKDELAEKDDQCQKN